jgi:hypothetical protein
MVSRSYKCIISKVTADVGLNYFSTNAISGDEVFILTLKSMTARHFVQGRVRCLFNKVRTSRWPKGSWDIAADEVQGDMIDDGKQLSLVALQEQQGKYD